ncbi:MAG: hypothetical protein LUO80_02215 [Methylococcaceae bacterium]|nr:hypothetical protein [Methylococcaceae bacterium]
MGGVTSPPQSIPAKFNTDRDADDDISGVGNRLVCDSRRPVSQPLQPGDM